MKVLLGISIVLAMTLLTANVLATDTTLRLENKDTDWKVISDGIYADLTFGTVGPKFTGTLTTHGLTAEKDYALIYYPDKAADRFNKWDGAGGVVITTWHGNAAGPIDKDLGINLPNTGDWNIIADPDYCLNHNGFDSYAHCRGAKIWIVPTADLTSGALPLTAWNPTTYLFETDLITYLDSDLPTTGTIGTEVVVPDPSCGVSATGIGGFGTMTRGTTNGPLTSTVTTSGDSSAAILLSGSNWNYNTEADGKGMDVGQTTFALDGYSTYYPLKVSPGDNLGTYISGSDFKVYFKLTIPSGAPAGDFVQTITFTGSC
jgi:hypothetical protein